MGDDYADDDLVGDVMLDKEKNAVTIEDIDENCCRAIRMKCQEIKNGNRITKKCKQQSSKVICNEGKITCKILKDYVRQASKSQKEEMVEQENKHIKKGPHEDIKEDDEEIIEDSDDKSYEGTMEEYDDHEEKKDNKEMKNVKSKHVNDLKPTDLIKLTKKMNKSQKRKGKSKKCLIKSAFRFAISLNYINVNNKVYGGKMAL